MTTLLDKTLKRELLISERPYILAISPQGLKLTPKGKRKGLELQWQALVSGEAALAVALNASIGKLAARPAPPESTPQKPRRPKSRSGAKRGF